MSPLASGLEGWVAWGRESIPSTSTSSKWVSLLVPRGVSFVSQPRPTLNGIACRLTPNLKLYDAVLCWNDACAWLLSSKVLPPCASDPSVWDSWTHFLWSMIFDSHIQCSHSLLLILNLHPFFSVVVLKLYRVLCGSVVISIRFFLFFMSSYFYDLYKSLCRQPTLVVHTLWGERRLGDVGAGFVIAVNRGDWGKVFL